MEAKQVRDLMEAYSFIYEKKHEPEMEEGEEKEESEKDEGGKHKEGKHKKGKEEKGEKVTEKEDEEDEKEMKESADLFDYILEHLVAEGYADTNKAALAIMANMSEEWKQSIVEAQKPLPTQRMKNRRYYVYHKTGEAAGSSRNEKIKTVLDAHEADPEGEAAKARAKSKYKG